MCLMHEVVSAPSDLDRRGERADGVLRVALLTVRLSELQQRTLLALDVAGGGGRFKGPFQEVGCLAERPAANSRDAQPEVVHGPGLRVLQTSINEQVHRDRTRHRPLQDEELVESTE